MSADIVKRLRAALLALRAASTEAGTAYTLTAAGAQHFAQTGDEVALLEALAQVESASATMNREAAETATALRSFITSRAVAIGRAARARPVDDAAGDTR